MKNVVGDDDNLLIRSAFPVRLYFPRLIYCFDQMDFEPDKDSVDGYMFLLDLMLPKRLVKSLSNGLVKLNIFDWYTDELLLERECLPDDDGHISHWCFWPGEASQIFLVRFFSSEVLYERVARFACRDLENEYAYGEPFLIKALLMDNWGRPVKQEELSVKILDSENNNPLESNWVSTNELGLAEYRQENYEEKYPPDKLYNYGLPIQVSPVANYKKVNYSASGSIYGSFYYPDKRCLSLKQYDNCLLPSYRWPGRLLLWIDNINIDKLQRYRSPLDRGSKQDPVQNMIRISWRLLGQDRNNTKMSYLELNNYLKQFKARWIIVNDSVFNSSPVFDLQKISCRERQNKLTDYISNTEWSSPVFNIIEKYQADIEINNDGSFNLEMATDYIIPPPTRRCVFWLILLDAAEHPLALLHQETIFFDWVTEYKKVATAKMISIRNITPGFQHYYALLPERALLASQNIELIYRDKHLLGCSSTAYSSGPAVDGARFRSWHPDYFLTYFRISSKPSYKIDEDEREYSLNRIKSRYYPYDDLDACWKGQRYISYFDLKNERNILVSAFKIDPDDSIERLSDVEIHWEFRPVCPLPKNSQLGVPLLECQSNCISCQSYMSNNNPPVILSGSDLSDKSGKIVINLPDLPGYYLLRASYYVPKEKRDIYLEMPVSINLKPVYLFVDFPYIKRDTLLFSPLPRVENGDCIRVSAYLIDENEGYLPAYIEFYHWSNNHQKEMAKLLPQAILGIQTRKLRDCEIELLLPGSRKQIACTDQNGQLEFTINHMESNGPLYVQLSKTEYCPITTCFPVAYCQQDLSNDKYLFIPNCLLNLEH